MRLSHEGCERYLARLAEQVERNGIVLNEPADGEDLELLEDDEGGLSFELVGGLPDGIDPGVARIEVREAFRPIGDGSYERSRYEYELLERARDYRRAFHLHFPDWFTREFLVLVHEHCERPIGHVDCRHYEGSPIKDAYAGIRVLMETWMGEPPDCGTLRCLG